MDTTLPFHGSATRAKPWIERLARVGFGAKAVLYFTVGLLAASAALGGGGKTTDSRGALGTLLKAPFGRVLLGVIAFGLVGYSVWRIIAGIKDAEAKGSGAKGLALRAGSIGRGVVHLALAGTAASLALAMGSRGGGDRREHWVGRALETPGGTIALWIVALGLVGYGAWQVYRGARAKLSKQLDLGQVSHGTRSWIVGISRFGIAARGIVFGMIGIMLGRAANRHDAKEAGGVADSLREIAGFGKWPFLVIAVGLVAYGVYELVEARYRRIRCG